MEGRSLKNIRASMGFEPMTSAIAVPCSTNWAVKPHIGSKVNLLSSYLPVQWNIYEIHPFEALIFFRLLPSNCLDWKIYCDDHSSLSSTTAVQREFHTMPTVTFIQENLSSVIFKSHQYFFLWVLCLKWIVHSLFYLSQQYLGRCGCPGLKKYLYILYNICF